MSCPEALRTQAYFDGEVDAPTALQVERHVMGCGPCRVLLDDLARARTEVRDALAIAPPPDLRQKVLHAIAEATGPATTPPIRRTRPRRPGPFWFGAFGGALAGAAAVALLTFLLMPAPQDLVLDGLVTEHVASLVPEHLVSVASTDHHTVKPWFAGHADVSPTVEDFTDRGFTLVGGRSDYLARQRAAVLVYRHGAHVINVFSWRADDGRAPRDTTREGYRLAFWRAGDLQYCAVSDTGWDELHRLRGLLQSAADGDSPGARE